MPSSMPNSARSLFLDSGFGEEGRNWIFETSDFRNQLTLTSNNYLPLARAQDSQSERERERESKIARWRECKTRWRSLTNASTLSSPFTAEISSDRTIFAI
jgi:hypothetical protein